jgi:hypothetical protein
LNGCARTPHGTLSLGYSQGSDGYSHGSDGACQWGPDEEWLDAGRDTTSSVGRGSAEGGYANAEHRASATNPRATFRSFIIQYVSPAETEAEPVELLTSLSERPWSGVSEIRVLRTGWMLRCG